MLIRHAFGAEWPMDLPRFICCVGDGAGQAGGGNAAGQGDGDPQPQPGGDGGRTTPGGDGGHEPPGDPKVTMPEKTFKERLARAGESAVKGVLSKLGLKSEGELDGLVAKLRESETAEQRSTREREELLGRVTAAEQRAAAAEARDRERSIVDAIGDALDEEAQPGRDGKGGRRVRNRQELVRLLRGEVDIVDGKPVVMKNGQPDHGTSVRALVKDYLDKNDHHILSNVPSGGAGSRPVPGGAPSQGRANPATYAGRRETFERLKSEGKI